MTIFTPRLFNLNNLQEFEIRATHPNHIDIQRENFFAQGNSITEMGRTVGAVGAVGRPGTFQQAMLQALDGVSANQHFASSLHQAAIIDPDSVDIHDVTIAQAQASISLNITRNVLNRVVQAWRDLINTR
jgi:flagellar hook-basal body complex protein FliE